MPRSRSPNRDKAFEIYKEHNGNIDLVEIGKSLNISDGTVRGWKNKDQWDDKLNGTLQKKSAKNTERSNKKVNKDKKPKEPKLKEVEEVLNNTQLTDKQRLFCIYYIKCFNATKAAIKAGYSKDTAGEQGYQLLQKTSIRTEIQRLKQNKLNRAMLSEDDIFQKYIDIAFADITEFLVFGQEEVPVVGAFGPIVDEEGNQVTKIVNVVKFKESIDIDGTIISEVKQGKDGASIKLQDKMKALQWLSDRLDLLSVETRIRLDNENAKMNIAREKLELEKQKANKNPDDYKPIEIIIKRKGEE